MSTVANTGTEWELQVATNAHVAVSNQFKPYDPTEAMRAALAAVEPLIRERLAAEVEAIRDERASEDSAEGCTSRFCGGWLLGQTHAARVIRGSA